MNGTSTTCFAEGEKKMIETFAGYITPKVLAFGIGVLLGIFFGVWLIGLSIGKFSGEEYKEKPKS